MPTMMAAIFEVNELPTIVAKVELVKTSATGSSAATSTPAPFAPLEEPLKFWNVFPGDQNIRRTIGDLDPVNDEVARAAAPEGIPGDLARKPS